MKRYNGPNGCIGFTSEDNDKLGFGSLTSRYRDLNPGLTNLAIASQLRANDVANLRHSFYLAILASKPYPSLEKTCLAFDNLDLREPESHLQLPQLWD